MLTNNYLKFKNSILTIQNTAGGQLIQTVENIREIPLGLH